MNSHTRLESEENGFLKQCGKVFDLLNKHDLSHFFRNLVNKEEVAKGVKSSMDLAIIEKRLKERYHYLNKKDFTKDVLLIFRSIKAKSDPSSLIYKRAIELEEYIKPYLEQMKESTENERKKLRSLKKTHKKVLGKRVK